VIAMTRTRAATHEDRLVRMLWAVAALFACLLLTSCTLLPGLQQGGRGATSGTGGTMATSAGAASGGTKASVPPPLPEDYPVNSPYGMFLNAGFEQGLAGWTVINQPGSRDPGNNIVETATWQERNGKVLHITRTSKQDGGASGVLQTPKRSRPRPRPRSQLSGSSSSLLPPVVARITVRLGHRLVSRTQ